MRNAAIFGATFLVSVTIAPAAELSSNPNLFFIKRSKNANEVHYDARVSDCIWRNPAIDSYWRMLAKGSSVYEEIGFLEKRAYGFDVKQLSSSTIEVRLTALPKRVITASLSRNSTNECIVDVTTKIRGASASFRSVYVFTTENLIGLPKVHYINILGHDDVGQPLFERVARTKRGEELGNSQPDRSQWQSGANTMGRS